MKPFGRVLLGMIAMLAFIPLWTGCELNNSGGGGDDDSDATDNGGGKRAKIVGTWNVDTTWRWSRMTFNADGTRSVVDRITGETLNRGTWSLKDGKLVVVSDVTEEWDFVVTATTLTATLPSGTVVHMTRIN